MADLYISEFLREILETSSSGRALKIRLNALNDEAFERRMAKIRDDPRAQQCLESIRERLAKKQEDDG